MDAHIPTLHHLAAALRELDAAEKVAAQLSLNDRAFVYMRVQESRREARLAVAYLADPETVESHS
jgi:hypothetical protein